MDANPRQFGLALAEYVVHNPSVEIRGEHLGALIYRIRLVEDYSPSDVDLVAKAMRNLVGRLVDLPAHTFCSDVWMYIIIAIAEGGIEDEWSVMVQEVDITDLAKDYMDAVSDFPSSRNPRRTGEQVNIICENLIIELGLIRRFFTAIWETDMEKTMNLLIAEKWEDLDIQSDKFSSQHAIRFLEMRVFDSFMMSKDHKKVATEVYFNTLTRMIIRTTLVEDDLTDIPVTFFVLEKVLSRMWFDLTDEKIVRKNTMIAFNKLITEGLSRQVDLQCVESFEDTCAWLKISPDEICELQDTLWSCFSSLTYSLFQLASYKSNENDLDSDNWLEKMCQKIPEVFDKKTAEEKTIRDKIDKIRRALNFILEAVMKSSSSDEAINMMKNTYSELVSSREIEIAARVKNVYKSFVDRGVISEDDQIKLAHEIIQSNSIQEIKAIVSCTAEESKIRQEIAKLYFQKLIQDMKNGEKMAPKMQEDSFECVSFLVRYLSQEVTIEIIKDLIEILPKAGENQDFAMQIFSLVVETCSPTEFSHRDEIGWYLDFNSLDVSHDTWDDIFTMIAEANLKSTEKKVLNGLTVLSKRQLTSEELSLKELLYVFKQLQYHRTAYGPNCLKKFYNETEEIKKASETFISHSHILKLSIRLLDILSSRVLEGNEWQDHSNSLENIYLWLEEFRVINDPEITPAIINLCNKIASWQLMYHFGITAGSVNLEDIYCFSRVWKCDLLSFFTPAETEKLENELDSKLRPNGVEKSSSSEVATKKSGKSKEKAAPKKTKQETQLITLFNDLCMHLLTMCQKLSPKLCNAENELFAWAIGVSCGGGAYAEAATTEARIVLSKKYGTHEITRLHRIHVMYYLMMGITSKKTNNTISLSEYFTSLYILLLKNDLINLNEPKNLEDLDKYMGNLTYWMDECADIDKKSCSFTESLMRKLGEIFVDRATGDSHKEFVVAKNGPFISKFVETFLGKMDKLPKWIMNSNCPITYLCANKKLFDMVFDVELNNEQKSVIHTALESSIDILFHEDSAESLLSENKYTIQMTDKQLFSAFNISFEKTPESAKSNTEQYLIRDCLKIFSKYGNASIWKKIVAKLNEMLPFLIHMISKHDKVLNGTRKILDDKKLVFNLMLVVELMDFCMEVSKFVFPWNFAEEQRFDHLFMMTDEDLHLQLNRATTKKDIKEEKKAEKAEEEKKEEAEVVCCTYAKSGRTFIHQHWYNCYTCNMTDTTGICSVCAVNCHRGHDLSYSKKGSFFCDCGANRCQAFTKAEHEPNFKNALRGQYPADKKLGSSKKVRVVPPYELPKDLVIGKTQKDELGAQLKILNDQIGKCQASFEKVVDSIWRGFDNSLNVAEKRNDVLKSLDNEKMEIMTDCVFMEEYMDIPEKACVVPCRRTDSAAERNASTGGTVSSNKVKDLADVMKLENGQEVWITIPESNQASLHLSYMDTRTNMIGGMQNVRQETEALPFVGRRLYVSGTRIAVCGVASVFAFRLSSTGDVIDRAHIKLTEAAVVAGTHTNPVVKAVWCREAGKQILAIATIQFVRIYDLTLDQHKFVEEMVLPVGNVEDMTMIVKSNGVLQILVLSTSGYLYEHYISTRVADNNSIFLTNIVPLPQMVPTASSGAGVSLFYSHTYDVLFVSLEKNTYCVRLPDRPEITSDDQDNTSIDKFLWRRLNLSTSVHSWKESDGIISCLSTTSPNNIFYVHIIVDQIMIQKMIVKRPILSQFLMTSSKNEAIYSVMLFADSPTVELHVTTWKSVRDLWIDDIPTEQIVVEVAEMQSQPEKIPPEDMVLVHEGCVVLTNVEWQSDDLAIFFEHDDLNKRLNDSSLPLLVIQKQKYNLIGRIGSNRHIVRGIRIEVDGVNGPLTVKIGKKVYDTETRVARIFDVTFEREESLAFDHREIHIEVTGRFEQEILCIRSLKFIGCPREIMDEVQPFYQHQPTLSLPHRFVSAFYDLNTALAHGVGLTEEKKKWLIGMVTKNLSRRENHPKVTISATKALQRLYRNDVEGLFKVIDGEMVKEWLYLREWDKEKGMGLLRKKHVELLIKRLQCTMTRWTVFEGQIKKYFTKILNYVELMRDEMIQMSLSTCQLMSTGLIRIIFGFLSQYSEESEELMNFFLNLFTDDKSYHLTSDMRSSVQFVTYHYGCAQRHSREKSLELEKEKRDHNYVVLKNFGVVPFYGRARVVEKLEQNRFSIALTGSMSISEFLDQKTIDSEFVWLNSLLRKTLDKMYAEGDKNSMPQILAQMCDSPSYGLTMVAVVLFSQYSFTRVQAHIDYLISLLKFDIDDILPMTEGNFRNFALLRLLEILLGRWVANEKKENAMFLEGPEAKKEGTEAEKKSSTLLLEKQTQSLVEKGVMEQCYQVLERVVPYWKSKIDMFSPNAANSNDSSVKRVWLPHVPVVSSSANPPNAEGYNGPRTAEDNYIANATELALRLPMLIHKICGTKFNENWYRRLCELAGIQNAPCHRHCKKLLMSICNQDKNKYRAMRDKFKMQECLDVLLHKYKVASQNCGGHQQLTEIVDVLNCLTQLVAGRPEMWRELCDNHTIWLLKLACSTADVIACSVVDLMIVAVRDNSAGGSSSIKLADRIIEAEEGVLLNKIITRFLVGKEETMRWTVHGFLRSIIQLASRQNQAILVKRLYLEIFENSRRNGSNSAQLVDLISTYAPRLFTSNELIQMSEKEMAEVEKTAKRFEEEGYSGTYRQFVELGIGWQGMLLSPNPCMICFNKKGATESVRLASIRADSRFTANTMIYKLNSNYEISRVTIKLTDVKKSRLMRKVSMYYCPRAVDGVVELKLSADLWRKCATTVIATNETLVNLQLAVPVITSSLIIEIEDFHEVAGANHQLQCPRCSVTVRSTSGVCENCGENAYQCIKCRVINYVDREPFLCQSCGYCKYARMDINVICRQLPGTQHITCDAERSQNIEEMAKVLVKMENTRAKLLTYKAYCDSLWFKTRPLAPFNVHVENNHVKDNFMNHSMMQIPTSSFRATVSSMAHASQALKTTHDMLCMQTEQLMALREELRRYDEANESPIVLYNPQHQGYYSTSEKCFGCMCASVIHSVSLLTCVTEDHLAHKQLMHSSALYDVVSKLGKDFHVLTEECEMLFVKLTMDHPEATRKVEKMIDAGKVDRNVFVKSLQQVTDSSWQLKLCYLIKKNMLQPDENSSLEVLTIINKYLESSRRVRQDVYRRIATRRKLSYNHSSRIVHCNNRVRAGNQKLPTREAVARWLTTREVFDACSVYIQTTPEKRVPPVYIGNFTTPQYEWISACFFSPFVSVRMAANRLLVNLSKQPGHEGVAILMMVEWLQKLSNISTDHSDQFMCAAHQILINSTNLKTRLFIEKFHVWLINEIHAECQKLYKKENDNLLADYEFGLRLRCYVELLCLMFSGSNVENILLKAGADDLLVILLVSTIFLKRMITRRNRAIDSSRLALEKLLRRVSSKDGAKMMSACSLCLKVMKDTNTLGHVSSVMLEVMDPQQEAEEDFLIQLEKDAAQEDFLQGRMSGNPYKSSDTGMGPLMRDIKNRICRDTEMIALMEDDNGMELLVCNNIISLALPVRQVYEKLWKRQGSGVPMLIVYRMRGLMGDAVETFISSFGDSQSDGDSEDNEHLVLLTKELVDCSGTDRLLSLLQTSNATTSGRFLLGQLRRVFERIVKTSVGRNALVQRKMVPLTMKVIRKCCQDTSDESKMTLAMDYYKVIELLVTDLNIHPTLTGIEESDAKWLIGLYKLRDENGVATRKEPIGDASRRMTQMLESMSANLGNVVLGSDSAENVLVERYTNVLKWQYIDKIDNLIEKEDVIWMADQLATTTSNILPSERGNRLKQKILDSGIISETCSYLVSNHPPLYSPTESPEWKQFLLKPSLKLMLNLLQGLARGHQASQTAIATTTLPLLHRLEQVASENSIGTMAENVMDALKEDKEVANKIETVRQETKAKKRQMAMAMRNKQLSKMGMQVGKGGEVKVASRKITNEPVIEDETDLSFTCCICRESALTGPKVAAVYAFAAPSPTAPERGPNVGTVSQMVMVHLDCHNTAIRRSATGRNVDEWNKAALHNAGARCNVMTPISTGQAADDVWTAALNRFLLDLETFAILPGGINRQLLFLDICKLIDRFIYKQSFSTQSHGGGRESNMQYLAIVHLLAVSVPAAENDLQTSVARYRLVTFLFTELTLASWNDQKYDVLRAALNDAQTSGEESTWQGMKPILLTWAFVDQYFNKVIPITDDDRLAWLRANLRETIKKTSRFVQDFDENVMVIEDVNEFCDVTGAPRDFVVPFTTPMAARADPIQLFPIFDAPEAPEEVDDNPVEEEEEDEEQ